MTKIKKTTIVSIGGLPRELWLRGIDVGKDIDTELGYNKHYVSLETPTQVLGVFETRTGRVAVANGRLLEATPDTKAYHNFEKAEQVVGYTRGNEEERNRSYDNIEKSHTHFYLMGSLCEEDAKFISSYPRYFYKFQDGREIITKVDVEDGKRKRQEYEDYKESVKQKQEMKERYRKFNAERGRGRYGKGGDEWVYNPYYITRIKGKLKHGLEGLSFRKWQEVSSYHYRRVERLVEAISSEQPLPLDEELTLWCGNFKTTIKRHAHIRTKDVEVAGFDDAVNAVFEKDLTKDRGKATYRDSMCALCPNRLTGLMEECYPSTAECVFRTRVLIGGEYVPKEFFKHVITKIFDDEFETEADLIRYIDLLRRFNVGQTSRMRDGYSCNGEISIHGHDYPIKFVATFVEKNGKVYLKYGRRKKKVKIEDQPIDDGWNRFNESDFIKQMIRNKLYKTEEEFYRDLQKKVCSKVRKRHGK